MLTQSESHQEFHQYQEESSTMTSTSSTIQTMDQKDNRKTLFSTSATPSSSATAEMPLPPPPPPPQPQVTENRHTDSSVAANQEFLEVRSKMLKEVASLRAPDTESEVENDSIQEENLEDSGEFSTSQERAAERAKKERNKELAEIAEMRCRANWQEMVQTDPNPPQSRSRSVDPELEEARNHIRTAAAKVTLLLVGKFMRVRKRKLQLHCTVVKGVLI